MQPNRPDEIFFDGEIYESQVAWASRQTDIPFWIDLAKMYGPKVLELACGTGRITLPLYESGVDIDGLDFSDSMLCVARDRSVAKSLPINFILGDIRTLSFHDRYDLISDSQILTVKNHYIFPDGSTKDGTIVLKLFFPAELQ